MSGEFTGLKRKMQKVNQKELFVHCIKLNVIIQNSLFNVSDEHNFIGNTVKSLINFVRDSPQCLEFFSDLKESEENIENTFFPRLKKYYLIKTELGVSSLVTI